MKLLNADKAVVSRNKVVEYLLSEDHPRGRYKAAFFMRLGFARKEWRLLQSALKRHARLYEISGLAESAFGTSYVIDGNIEGPNRTRANIRTVWFIEDGEDTARLITAYPRGRSSSDVEGA